MKELDIRTKSYLYGLFLSDGYFLSQKNKITGMGIELSARDKDLINKLVELFPEGTVSFRHRDTNYKKDYESCVFSCYRKDFADIFIQMGIPIKNKSEEAHSPIMAYIDEESNDIESFLRLWNLCGYSIDDFVGLFNSYDSYEGIDL